MRNIYCSLDLKIIVPHNINRPILTIGMPVYNGENFLNQRVKSILNQTHSDFTLIISDNGSTDKSQEICEEISKHNERIIYFRHEDNLGGYWNFNFLLKKANTKYFVWAAVDDIWSENFLEQNIDVLENNENVVGSIGEYKVYKIIDDSLSHENKIKVIENKSCFQYVHPVHGKINEKINFYLNYNTEGCIYGVFRTDKLKKAGSTFNRYKNNLLWMGDLAYILNVIKEGDFEVVNDAFMYKHVSNHSTSVIQYMKRQNFSSTQILLMNFPFTFWCLKNLGLKIVLKNLKYFLKLNLKGEYSIIAEFIRMCKRMLSGKEKYW